MSANRYNFRAWDGDMKMMVGGPTGTYPDWDHYISFAFGNVYEFDNDFLTRKSNQVQMQSTGFEDVNDVEIFEGDIIKSISFSNYLHQRGAIDIFTVRHFAGNSCLCYKDSESGVPMFPFNVTHSIEVIGNIYENPELIKEDQ